MKLIEFSRRDQRSIEEGIDQQEWIFSVVELLFEHESKVLYDDSTIYSTSISTTMTFSLTTMFQTLNTNSSNLVFSQSTTYQSLLLLLLLSLVVHSNDYSHYVSPIVVAFLEKFLQSIVHHHQD